MSTLHFRTFLSGFQQVLPLHCLSQSDGLDWLAKAHTLRLGEDRNFRRMAERFGCGPDRIATRYHEPIDFQEPPHAESVVFAGLTQKMEFYQRATRRVFREFYLDGASLDSAPSEVIHVTCTGYVSPSTAQERIAELGWHEKTRITHAYHMGCYASLPALRMAEGALFRNQKDLHRKNLSVDVVHTEICSLHFAPGDPRPDQWVIQSLFADGFIRYEAQICSQPPSQGSLEVLCVEEELVPGTADQMTWVPAENGFAMTLGREVPQSLARAVPAFVEKLAERASVPFVHSSQAQQVFFAIHPGGPKIVDGVAEVLQLKPEQSAQSRELLRLRGNLSSATLPHLWSSFLENDEVKEGALIVSLAFGPGLSLFGAVFRVHKPKRIPESQGVGGRNHA